MALVIIGGMRQRHKEARHAAGSRLAHRHGAGAGDHQVATGVETGHIVAIGEHFGLDTGHLIGGAHLLPHRLIPAGHMGNGESAPLPGQQGTGLGHALIEHTRTLRAAEHQEARRVVRLPGDPGDLGAHQVAGHHNRGAPVQMPNRAGKAEHDAAAVAGKLAVDHAGHGILFVQHNRDMAEQGGEHAGSTGITADTNQKRRAPLTPPAAPDGEDRLGQFPEQDADLLQQPRSLHGVHGQEQHRFAALWQQFRLQAARRANETHLQIRPATARRVGQCQRRHDMAAGAAAGDAEQRRLAHARPSSRVSAASPRSLVQARGSRPSRSLRGALRLLGR